MRLIKTKEAVGCILCHDITQIIKGVTKDAIFRKGHMVTEEDIPILISVGKEHLYIWEAGETRLHEDDAAKILADMCQGTNMRRSEAKEGKIDLFANADGLFKIDSQKLFQVNGLGQMMIASRHSETVVKKGDKLCGTRIIPLVIEKEKMDLAMEVAGVSPIMNVLPFHKKKAGIITTGSEVYRGIIKDTFTPVIKEKLSEFHTEIIDHVTLPDDSQAVTKAILDMIELGAELVLCSGGMSVDPDDQTPAAIKNTGARMVSYGAPVLPGAMFLLAYYEKGERLIPIMGLPGCVMYAKRTIFDLLLPRIMADDEVFSQELAFLGEGGLCLSCPVCTYPNCGFGKGGSPRS